MNKTTREMPKNGGKDKLLKRIKGTSRNFNDNGMLLKPIAREIISASEVRWRFEVIDNCVGGVW